MKQSLANGFVSQGRGMRLKRPPVFGVGPRLMRVQFVKIRSHRFLPLLGLREFTALSPSRGHSHRASAGV
jgi:hypothetical protein